MWEKVQNARSRGSPARTRPAVQRSAKTPTNASLLLPAEMAQGERASVYSDGNGKLAFLVSDDGEYKVQSTGVRTKAKRITIPRAYVDRIPYGTTDVSLSADGAMLVLDLSQLPT